MGKIAINSKILLPFCVTLTLMGCLPHTQLDPLSSHLAVKEDTKKEAIHKKMLKNFIQDNAPKEVLRRTENTNDLNLLSYRAIALDLLQEHFDAQTLYKKILEKYPKKTSILNNLALSYYLSAQADKAEDILKSCPICTNFQILQNHQKIKY